MADMTKDAMAAAYNHLKVAHDNLIKAQTWLDILSAGHSPVPRPQSGLTGVWMCLALLIISLIVLAQFLRRRNFDVASGSLMSKCQNKMDNCLRHAYEILKSSPTLITHVDGTCARFLQWKTIALCSMFLVVSVSAVYLIMVTPVFGLTGVWTGLIIFMSLIGTAGLLRSAVITGQHKFHKEEAQQQRELTKEDPSNNETTIVGAISQQPSELTTSDQNNQDTTSEGAVVPQPSEPIKPDSNNNEMTSAEPVPQPPSEVIVINKENMTAEIKDSINDLESFQKRLESTKLDKFNKKEVEDIKDAIKAVRSIEKHLTLLRSQNNNYGKNEERIQDALNPAIDAVQFMEKIINDGI